jgi:quinol monooxygenase YgiN
VNQLEQQLHTLTIWSVKEGNEEAFIRSWQEFAQWTLRHHPGAGEADLLRDDERPRLFVVLRRWKDTRSIEAWRQSPEFREFITEAMKLCDDVQPHFLKTVAQARKSRV